MRLVFRSSLHWQIAIAAVVAILGTAAFCKVGIVMVVVIVIIMVNGHCHGHLYQYDGDYYNGDKNEAGGFNVCSKSR